MATRRKKLYFNINLTTVNNGLGATLVFGQAVACTQFRATYGGDVYGSVLEDLAALTIGSSDELKRRNEVTAWFQPITGQIVAAVGTPFRNQRIYVRFILPTVMENSILGPTYAPGLAFTGQPNGTTPIGTRHFGILVARDGAGSATDISPTVRGRLFVQRQHNIEI